MAASPPPSTLSWKVPNFQHFKKFEQTTTTTNTHTHPHAYMYIIIKEQQALGQRYCFSYSELTFKTTTMHSFREDERLNIFDRYR